MKRFWARFNQIESLYSKFWQWVPVDNLYATNMQCTYLSTYINILTCGTYAHRHCHSYRLQLLVHPYKHTPTSTCAIETVCVSVAHHSAKHSTYIRKCIILKFDVDVAAAVVKIWPVYFGTIRILFAYLIRDAVSQRRVFHFSALILCCNSVNDDSASARSVNIWIKRTNERTNGRTNERELNTHRWQWCRFVDET